MLNIVVLLVIVAVVALVAVQNATPVVLTFLVWSFQASLSVIIFLSVFAGMLIAAIFLFSSYVKRMIKSKRPGVEEIQKKSEGG